MHYGLPEKLLDRDVITQTHYDAIKVSASVLCCSHFVQLTQYASVMNLPIVLCTEMYENILSTEIRAG